jgi:hypothetical protein
MLTDLTAKFNTLTNHQKALAGVGAAVLLIIVAARIHAMSSAPERLPVPPQTVAPSGANPGSNSSVGSPATPQASTPAPSSAFATLFLPGQPQPAGLTPQTMGFALASQSQSDWVSLGAIVEPASVASFTTKAPDALASAAPTDGILRNTWTFWTHIDKDGKTTLVLHLAGDAPTLATVAIDDSQDPQVTARLDVPMLGMKVPPVTVANGTGLRAGWHKFTVTMTHQVAGNFHGFTTGTLGMVRDGDNGQVAIIPASVDAAAAGREAAAAAAASVAPTASDPVAAVASASAPATSTSAPKAGSSTTDAASVAASASGRSSKK